MYNRQITVFVLLLLCCLRVLSGDRGHQSQCSLKCMPPTLHQGELYTKCNISQPLKVHGCDKKFYNLLGNISFLDLSASNLKQVPRDLFLVADLNLTVLSLAHNDINTIETRTFMNLTNLHSLYLSFNDLREWEVDPKSELKQLDYLDVTGNQHWLPSEQLLQLSNLETVEGATWTEYCPNCALVKLEADGGEANISSWCGYLRSPREWWFHDDIQYGKALEFVKKGFWPTCLCDSPCFEHQVHLPWIEASSEVAFKSRFALYAKASLALLVNIAVVLVIVCSPSLRRDLAVCLILSVTLCDIVISLACLLYAIYPPNKLYIDSQREILADKDLREDPEAYIDVEVEIEKIRNIIGPILTCAVASQVAGSFILTLEKFLKIVFTMRPGTRIGKRIALVYLLVSWSCCAIFAIVPVFEVGGMTYNVYIDNIPVPSDEDLSHIESPEKVWVEGEIGIATAVKIGLVIIQLVTLLLYLPIFIVARKSGASLGIKRETAIAKKIALLVVTNLIFFAFPVLVIGSEAITIWDVYAPRMQDNWQDYAFESFQWFLFVTDALPVCCVSINSVLNPFLYALRHPKIKQQVAATVRRCTTAISGCFAFLRQHLQCQTNRVEQGTGREMQHNDAT